MAEPWNQGRVLRFIVEADELLTTFLRGDSLYVELLSNPLVYLYYAFDSFAAVTDGPPRWAQRLSEKERSKRLMALKRLIQSGALICEPSPVYKNALNAAHLIWYPGACWATLCLAIAKQWPILTGKRQYQGIGLGTWHPKRLHQLLSRLPLDREVGPPWLRCDEVSAFDERYNFSDQLALSPALRTQLRLQNKGEIQQPVEVGTEVSAQPMRDSTEASSVTMSNLVVGALISAAAFRYFAARDHSKKTAAAPPPESFSTRRPVWTFLKFMAASVAFYFDVKEEIRRRSVENVSHLTSEGS